VTRYSPWMAVDAGCKPTKWAAHRCSRCVAPGQSTGRQARHAQIGRGATRLPRLQGLAACNIVQGSRACGRSISVQLSGPDSPALTIRFHRSQHYAAYLDSHTRASIDPVSVAVSVSTPLLALVVKMPAQTEKSQLKRNRVGSRCTAKYVTGSGR